MKTIFLIFVLCQVAISSSVSSKESIILIDGLAIEIYVQGDGEEVVVFESGFGTDASVWKSIAEQLGPRFKTIRYSRVGLGRSDESEKPRTVKQHTIDLEKLLRSLKITEPVNIVGHSYGGLLAAEFTHSYPDIVKGIVLIDPATISQRHAFMAVDQRRVVKDEQFLINHMPKSFIGQYKLLITQMESSADEIKPIPENVPTILITSTKQYEKPLVLEETIVGRKVWLSLHQKLFSRVKKGLHIRTPNAGHNIHIEKPELIVGAIDLLLQL